MSLDDEIVEEVRRVRRAYAARFDYDLARIFEDLKEKEQVNPAPHADFTTAKRQGRDPQAA